MTCYNTCESLLKKLIRDTVPKDFVEDWSCGYPSMSQNFSLGKGKQMFSLKSFCWHTQFRYSKLFLSGNDEKPLHIQASRC